MQSRLNTEIPENKNAGTDPAFFGDCKAGILRYSACRKVSCGI
jgi:hypothetical protein